MQYYIIIGLISLDVGLTPPNVAAGIRTLSTKTLHLHSLESSPWKSRETIAPFVQYWVRRYRSVCMEDDTSRLHVFVKIMQMKKIARRQSEDAQGGSGEKTKKNGKSSTKPRKIDDAAGSRSGVTLNNALDYRANELTN